MQEIGDALGISESRVSQIHSMAVNRPPAHPPAGVDELTKRRVEARLSRSGSFLR
ncbi:MAG TPA: sigma factor-like helix-turn-helix DNA-binding protein [Terriglobales bacterium]|nr:sigma factor-like helix-turn-helix DNA-binding protein [Terriglobales bacterium]